MQYPASTFAPRDLRNRTLTLLIDGQGTLVNHFNAAGGGTFSFNGTPGAVLEYDWTQGIYRGDIWPIYYDWLNPLTLQFFFASDGGGTFSGRVYDFLGNYLGDIAGSFTLSRP